MGLAEFMKGLGDDNDLQRALVDKTLELARPQELADAIELCAIPRRFDEEILGVLRARPDDREGNEHLLGALRGYPFVRVRESGGFVYHDAVRTHLLGRWRQPERREQFNDATWRLVRHHESVHDQVYQAEDHAARVARIVRHASEERYLQLARLLDGKLLAPLLEAVQQLVLLSASDTSSFLERHLDRLMDRGRYGTCRALILGAEGNLATLSEDPGLPLLVDMLRLWEGRVLLRADVADEAERVLRQLAESKECDPHVRYHALGELGQAQRAQGNLRGATETFAEEVRLAETSGVDPNDASLSYLRLGDTYLMLQQPGLAHDAYDKAVEIVTGSGAAEPLVSALEAIAEAEIELGALRDGFEHIMTALDLARTEVRTRRSIHGLLATTLATYCAVDRPELVLTLAEEHQALIAGLDEARESQQRVQWLAVMRHAGLFDRAARSVKKYDADLDRLAPRVRGLLLDELAALELERRRWTKALKRLAWAEPDDEGDVPIQFRAAGLLARGQALVELRRWPEAADTLGRAAVTLRRLGYDPLAGLATAESAQALRALGDIDAAAGALAEAAEALADASPGLIARYLRARALHEAATDRCEEAGETARMALSLVEKLGNLSELAEAHATASRCAESCGNHDVAEREAAAEAGVRRRMDERNRWSRPRNRRKADEENAQGVRCLFSENVETARTARDHFERALRKEGDPWYRLNLAYSCAALDDWDAAVAELTAALEEGPWLRCRALDRRLASYHVVRGESILQEERYEDAVEAFWESLERLTEPTHAQARQRCLLGLGESLRHLGRTDDAIDAYRRADVAGHPAALATLGELLTDVGRTAEAIEVFREGVVRIDGVGSADAAVRLVELLGADHPQERDDVLKSVSARGGTRAALELADRLLARESLDGAAAAYAVAERELPVATLRLARLHRRAGESGASRHTYERALLSDDADVASLAAAELADVLLAEGDRAEATAVLRRTLGSFPGAGSARAALRLGELLLEDGNVDDAEPALAEAAESRDPVERSRALIRLGDLHASTGRRTSALDLFLRALAAPDAEVAVTAAAQLLEAPELEGDQRAAVIDSVLRRGARVGLLLADMLAERGDQADAVEVLGHAAAMVDDLYAPDAALRLGDLLAADGRTDEARSAYRQALESDDETVLADAALHLVEELGEPPDAIDTVIERADYSTLRLARMLYERGQEEVATQAFSSVVDAGGLYAADAALSLGDLRAAAGDRPAAAAAYRQARDSGSPWAVRVAEDRLHWLSSPGRTTDEWRV